MEPQVAQTRIGYKSWKGRITRILSKPTEVTPVSGASLGASIDGWESVSPGGAGTPTLPPFDFIKQQTSWVDAFRRCGEIFPFSISANPLWVKFSASQVPRMRTSL